MQSILKLPGHSWLVPVPRWFMEDEFNLIGLSSDTSITDLDAALDCLLSDTDEDRHERDGHDLCELSDSAKHAFYLIHQRWIQSKQGLSEVYHAYQQGRYGKCRRWLCHGHAVIPCGESAHCGRAVCRVYCPHCGELYKVGDRVVDGAAFGPNIPALVILSYRQSFPMKALPAERRAYVPRIFGFRLARVSHNVH